MTTHDLAMLAIADGIKAARDLLKQLEGARAAAGRQDYAGARTRIRDAASTASYLDHHYLRNAGTAVEACK